MGTSAIVGSSVSLAVGDAFARQLREDEIVRGSDQSIPSPDDAVTVAFAGDAVPETGQFWEALNFAALKQLRLIIVIENNGLATSTILDDRQSFHHGPTAALQASEVDRYSFLDFPTFAETADEVTRLIANNVWPIVISADVERFAEHVGPAIDDRIGTGDDQLVAMRIASVAWHDAPKTTLAEAEHFIDCGVAAVFDEMADFDLHPWAKGMNE
jgi:TPP-dependent pyruvate/acetoin dehydrogenase alpha subunit